MYEKKGLSGYYILVDFTFLLDTLEYLGYLEKSGRTVIFKKMALKKFSKKQSIPHIIFN